MKSHGQKKSKLLVFAALALAASVPLGVLAEQEGPSKVTKKGRAMTPIDDTELEGIELLSREISPIVRETIKEHRYARPTTLDGVLKKTGKGSPAKMLEWVREEIEFEPYDGALRSPTIVLETGHANAVDAARLLFALIERSGSATPTYAWGELPSKEAAVMLLKFGELVKFELDGVSREADQPLPGHLLRQVRDHVWVEIAMKGGERQALDPFASLDAFNTPAKRASSGGDIPKRFLASLSAKLLVTFDDGREQDYLTIKGSVDELAHETITISFERDDTLAHTTRPVLIRGGKLDIGDYFPHERVQEIAIKFKLSTGGYEQLFEQVLYEEGRSLDIFAAEQVHVGMTLLPGWTSKGLVARHGGEGFKEALLKLDVMAKEQRRHERREGASKLYSEQEYTEQTRALVHDVFGALPYLYAHQLDKVILELGELMAIRPVLNRPRLLVTAMVRDGDAVFVDIDMRGESLDGVPAKGMPFAISQGFVSLYSRAESEVRGSVLDALASTALVTTPEIVHRTRKKGLPLLTLSAPDTSQAKKLELPKSTTTKLARSVKRAGKIVLSPPREIEIKGRAEFGWWEVDPVEGWFEGRVARGLLNQPISAVTEDEAIAQGIGFLALGKLLGKQIAVWLEALDGARVNSSLICSASNDLSELGELMCAKKESERRTLPTLDVCLGLEASSTTKEGTGDGGAAMGDPLGGLVTKKADCDDLARSARCGAVIARAFLGGKIKVQRGNDLGEFVSSSPSLSCD